MNKKLIAAALAVLLVALSFSACGKKKTITAKNGKEYEVVTDENGNMQYGAEDDVYVYQKDEKGKYVLDENGEKKQLTVQIAGAAVDEKHNTIETEDYRFTFDQKGWEVSSYGTFFLKDSDDNAVMQILYSGTLEQNGNLETVFEAQKKAWQLLVDNYNSQNEGRKAELKVQDVKITDKQVEAKRLESYVYDIDGKVLSYSSYIFFTTHGKLYRISFDCTDGKYYDPNLDVLAAVNEGLVIKDQF